MDINFSSQIELYNKLIPVFKTKINEMSLKGITYINESIICNYHKEKWSKKNNLEFSDIVSDILNTSEYEYILYEKNKRKEKI